ncbi:LANO_0E07228g1_1 [Lachancea nothofagi CBS 11611]|uniref:Eukaryotic translation initiation factor 3 subunit A n=1 Tax=Lachancea nothofagi CBS 11611 TaxID=1266666 RepID=A0A1G4JUP1_9SACH|nr:LANO_0E07228g1_1 [Lachancea nothofagi CBS 11611]
MAPPVLRPENALKRAEELISVGDPLAALQSLYAYLSMRRIRFAQPQSLEPIVFKFLELGVTLKKGKIIKDGLHQYKKNMQISPEGLSSVGVVSRKFIDLIEVKIAEEQTKADELEQNDADEDLEGGVTPENLLISAAEEEQSVAGFNDEALTSWLRFTWESYRAVLDLVRNNSQLELTYSGAVNRTMNFCLKYNRKNEFKRLAEMLRQHLDSANYQHKYNNYTVDLSDASTLQRYLDQRFQQVNVSVKLELWHEAFRSIEDVHHLMAMSKRSAKPPVLANYYENLAKIFFVSGNYLLNAAAWEKFYKLYLTNPKATKQDFQFYASTFMLASLSIPSDELPVVGFDPLIRLCNLLSLESKPTRQQLIGAATEDSVFSEVDDEVKQLHSLLGEKFDIKTIKDELTQLLPALEAKAYFQQYAVPLRNFIIKKLFIGISEAYETIEFEELVSMVTLPGPFNLTRLQIEKSLMQAAMEDYVTFTIDHEADAVTFSKDPFEALAAVAGASALAEDVEEDEESEDAAKTPEGEETEVENEPEPVVTRNAAIRAHLSDLAKLLKEVEGFADGSYMYKVKVARENLIQQSNDTIARERKAAEERAKQIEERKKGESGKYLTAEQAAEDRLRRMMEEKAAADSRMEIEAKRRAEEKLEREKAMVREMEMVKLIEEVNAKGIIHIDPKDSKTMTAEDIRRMTIEQLSKDKKDLEDRMRHAFKKIDYMERALRKVELPALEKDAEKQESRDLENYNKMKTRLMEAARKEHEENTKLHERLAKMNEDYKAFKANLVSTRGAQLAELRAQNIANFEAAKKARIDKIRQERYEQLVEERKAELKAEEESARIAKEREERLRVNKEKDELYIKQREREEAIEKQLSSQRSAPAAAPAAAAPAAPAGKISYAERMRLRRQGIEVPDAEPVNRTPAPVAAPAPAPEPVAAPAPAPVAAPAPAPVAASIPAPDATPAAKKELSFAEKMRLKRAQR